MKIENCKLKIFWVYLKRLEIQGFKSFANQTVLEFQPGITAIVGPNGSGKSNIADGVRWVLGEQSKTLLRGKKAEDVIFVGSAGKSRATSATVSVYFDNQDKKLPIDSAEVVFTRRLYRDGTSEYLINNETVRLMDITEALSKAGFVQSRYTVIGQGIIEQFLLQGPVEIKAVIEEAAGLSPFYDRLQKTARRLEVTRENLTQVNALTAEIEPRLRSLRRQAKRLEQRALVESQWRQLRLGRLAFIFSGLTGEKEKYKSEIEALAKKIEVLEADLQDHFDKINEGDTASQQGSQTVSALQQRIAAEQNKKERLQIELTTLRAQMGSGLPSTGRDLGALAFRRAEQERQLTEVSQQLADFEQNLAEIETDINAIIDILNKAKPDLVPRFNLMAEKFINNQRQFINRLKDQQEELARKLKSVLAEIELGSHEDGAKAMAARQKTEADLQSQLAVKSSALAQWQAELQKELQSISSYTSARREADKQIRAKERELNQLRSNQNELKISQARAEARFEEESRKAAEDLGANYMLALVKAEPIADGKADEQIMHLKRQLELVGGLDDLTLQEYEETEARYTYLTAQVHDLEKAATDLEQVLAELRTVIREKFNEAFNIISTKFSDYFRMLFNGGKADLKKLKSEKLKIPNEGEAEPEEAADEPADHSDRETLDIIGVEVTATPPGKKLSSIAALSGGERTLTSIALVIALLDAYPSPFVVLDEVDAALDESNSIRFAKILGHLADRTQFITITHNRETMRRGHTLYGVTMGDNGISQILSIKFDQSLAYAKE